MFLTRKALKNIRLLSGAYYVLGVLVLIISIIFAFIIGGITSDLFVPLFQYMYDVNDQIPPYRVAAMQADYIKMYVLIALMLLGGFAILGAIIRKININKALKLGED